MSGMTKQMRTFSAKIIKGEGRGKKIGFPTINLNPVNISMDYGVYLVYALINDIEYNALLHFGPKKTFDADVSAEIYIKNNLELLPENVIIKVIRKIRDVKKFRDTEELKEQIIKDSELIK